MEGKLITLNLTEQQADMLDLFLLYGLAHKNIFPNTDFWMDIYKSANEIILMMDKTRV